MEQLSIDGGNSKKIQNQPFYRFAVNSLRRKESFLAIGDVVLNDENRNCMQMKNNGNEKIIDGRRKCHCHSTPGMCFGCCLGIRFARASAKRRSLKARVLSFYRSRRLQEFSQLLLLALRVITLGKHKIIFKLLLLSNTD